MKSFEHWNFEEVEETFGLTKVRTLSRLRDWLATPLTLTPDEITQLKVYQESLLENVDTWNEEELKIFFIGPILMWVNYNSPHYKPFLGRNLGAKIGSLTLKGKVDFMVATGKVNPKQPFFFLHEYKRARGRTNDPLGQLLIAMVVAQSKNKRPQPIYGAYIEGKFWNFVILEAQQYAVSRSYDATQADLFNIVSILGAVKQFIQVELNPPSAPK